MERYDAGDAGPACNRTGLGSGEMAPLRSQGGILVQERRLDEQLVGAPRQLDDFFEVRIVERGVDYIGEFVPWGGAQGALSQQGKRNG